MSTRGEFYVDVVCRDAELLPAEEAEFRAFFDGYLAPQIFEEMRAARITWADGSGGLGSRAIPGELTARGCVVSGGIRWKI